MITRSDSRIALALAAAAVSLAGALFCCRVALAQGAPDAATADAEFRIGNKLRVTDRALACEHYLRSMELDPNPTVLVRIGECHEREGKLRQGLADYRRAEQLNSDLNRDRQQHQTALAEEIRRRLLLLDGRTPKVNLSVTPRPGGLEVFLDGEALAATALDTPAPVDRAGTHELRARAPGYQEVAASGIGDLSVTLLPVPPPVPETPPPVPKPVRTPPPIPLTPAMPTPSPPNASEERASVRADQASSPGTGQRVAGYVAGGTGLAVLGVAGYFGLRTLSLVKKAGSSCDDSGCDDPGYGQLQEASRAQTTGFILAGVGAGLVGLGTVLVLTAPHGNSTPTRYGTAGIVVTLGPRGASATGAW